MSGNRFEFQMPRFITKRLTRKRNESSCSEAVRKQEHNIAFGYSDNNNDCIVIEVERKFLLRVHVLTSKQKEKSFLMLLFFKFPASYSVRTKCSMTYCAGQQQESDMSLSFVFGYQTSLK